MAKKTGARRQVLAKLEKDAAAKTSATSGLQQQPHLQQQLEAPASHKLSLNLKPVHTSAPPLAAPAPVSTATPAAANLHIHSSSEPVLSENETYTIKVTQEISYSDVKGVSQTANSSNSNLALSKQFRVQGSKSTLDSSLIHSVYPPPGHAAYWNVLPHVLFNDPETPWLFRDDAHPHEPWLALFVFNRDELLLSPDDLGNIQTALGPNGSRLAQGTKLSVQMTNTEFQSLAANGSSPMGTGKAWGDGQMDAIFINSDLYKGLFKSTDRRWDLSHVRTVDTSGMADSDGTDVGTFAATVSQRTGPLNPDQRVSVYAHLVVIPGADGSGAAVKTNSLTGLCSLYSWSYSCMPLTEFSLRTMFQNLGLSIQPLRLPNKELSDASQSGNLPDWTMARLKAGYSIARYRPLTGEVSICMFRGLLIPDDPYSVGDKDSRFSSSDFGADLSIVDSISGILDTTYSMAWTLGRSMAMSDRSFSAALMRLRGAIHNTSLTLAKKVLDKSSDAPVHKPISDAVGALSDTSASLETFGNSRSSTNMKARWQKPSTRPSSRNVYSFVYDNTKNQYKKCLDGSAVDLGAAASPDPLKPSNNKYDETSPPASTDWATVLAWILDKWFLGGIPNLHLITDPSFVPKESIRSFFIDPHWIRSLVDGALSVAEHHTDDDDVRVSIKNVLEVYLSSFLSGKDHTPQVPRYGMRKVIDHCCQTALTSQS